MGYKIKKIYVGTQQVRPAWKPNANTIAYFPLKENTADVVGNYTITTGTATKQSIGYRFTGRADILNVSSSIVDRTLSFWIKFNNYTTSSSTYCDACQLRKYFIAYYLYHSSNSSLTQKYVVFTNSSGSSVTGPYSVGTGNWYHFCSVADTNNNKMYGYINGTKVLEYNGLGYDFGLTNIRIFANRNGADTQYYTSYSSDVSEVILEDKAWSGTDITNYYNQTKSNYGL